MTNVVRVRAPGGPDQLELATIDLPAPAAGEVRIRQMAIGVNSIDVYHRTGLYPLPAAAIPGVEAAGVIAAVGENVTSLRAGDRVAYAGAPVGAYASERNLPAARAIPLPNDVTDEAVASVLVKGITAHMLLTQIYPAGPGAFTEGGCVPQPRCACACHRPGGMAVNHLVACCDGLDYAPATTAGRDSDG